MPDFAGRQFLSRLLQFEEFLFPDPIETFGDKPIAEGYHHAQEYRFQSSILKKKSLIGHSPELTLKRTDDQIRLIERNYRQ